MLLTGARANLGRLWLENMLYDRGVPGLDAYFSKVTPTMKNSRALLPVFFRQAGSCIVTRDGFETMSELNPQLRTGMRAVAVSPEFLASVICVRRDYRPDLKEELISSLERLDEDPKGRQILTLFKIDRLIPYKASYLDSARLLLATHRKSTSRVRNGKVASR